MYVVYYKKMYCDHYALYNVLKPKYFSVYQDKGINFYQGMLITIDLIKKIESVCEDEYSPSRKEMISLSELSFRKIHHFNLRSELLPIVLQKLYINYYIETLQYCDISFRIPRLLSRNVGGELH